MRPDRIVLTPPALDDDLDFPQRVEDFTVKREVGSARAGLVADNNNYRSQNGIPQFWLRPDVRFGSLADIPGRDFLRKNRKSGPMPKDDVSERHERNNLQDRRKPSIQLDKEQAIAVRKPDAPMYHPAQQKHLVSDRSILISNRLFDSNGEPRRPGQNIAVRSLCADVR